MKKVIIYIAMSLDGYIADKNGSVAFLKGQSDGVQEINGYEEFYDKIGEVILGYKTYHQVVNELAVDNYPYSDKITYVFTSKNMKDSDNVKFVSEDVNEFIDKLKNGKTAGDIWINGGASIVNEILKNRAFDELIISIIPTILGSGIKLFENYEEECELKLESYSVHNGIAELKYVKR